MEWVLKLEAKSGWGEVETIEVGRLERRTVGTAEIVHDEGEPVSERRDVRPGRVCRRWGRCFRPDC